MSQAASGMIFQALRVKIAASELLKRVTERIFRITK
jgi:hypothetical protein